MGDNGDSNRVAAVEADKAAGGSGWRRGGEQELSWRDDEFDTLSDLNTEMLSSSWKYACGVHPRGPGCRCKFGVTSAEVVFKTMHLLIFYFFETKDLKQI